MFTLGLLILILTTNVHCMLFRRPNFKSNDTYGPYVVTWKSYGVCPTSKPTLAQFTAALLRDGDNYIGILNITMSSYTRFDKIKVVIYSINNDIKSTILNYDIDKPCQHELYAAILKQQLRSKNCVLRKGFQQCSINLTNALYKFYGTSVFYGEYLTKAMMLSQNQMIMCLTIHVVLDKKT